MGCSFSRGESDRNAAGMGNVAIDEVALAASTINGGSDLTSRVELNISCRNLLNKDSFSKSDPFCVVYKVERGVATELMRTEIVSNNVNPDFVSRFTTNYNFEQVQTLRFAVYDADDSYKSSNAAATMNLANQDFLGSAEIQLAVIFGSVNQTWTGSLTDLSNSKCSGQVVIRGEELSNINSRVSIILHAENLTNKEIMSKSDPFLKFSRCREDNSYCAVFKTEVKMNNLNPRFNRIDGSLISFANGDIMRPLKIECFDWNSSGSHTLIGECICSLHDLRNLSRNVNGVSGNNGSKDQKFIILTNKSSGARDCGRLFVDSFDLEAQPSFLDYVKQSSCEIAFIVAIDYTASNGDPRFQDSLHYVDTTGSRINHYAHAISSVGKVLEYYDSDKRFPVYGFGGKSTSDSPVNHCFAINGDESNPEVVGVQGILNAYYQSLALVMLSGPTYFSKIINCAAAISRSYQQTADHQTYFILLIITDGVINDIDNTINAIVEASQDCPLSLLIVGVGNDVDFDPMKALDSDDKLLKSEITGKACKRDIVQFVPMRDVAATSLSQSGRSGNPALMQEAFESALAKELLAEIPRQLVSYYTSGNILPSTYSALMTSTTANDSNGLR